MFMTSLPFRASPLHMPGNVIACLWLAAWAKKDLIYNITNQLKSYDPVQNISRWFA